MSKHCALLPSVLALTLALAHAALAHYFPVWLPLEPVGYLDPFGHESLQRYTDVASDGRRAWLSSRDRGVAILELSAAGEPRSRATYAPSPLPSFTGVALGPDAVYLATNGQGIHIIDPRAAGPPQLRSRIDAATDGFDRVGRIRVHEGRLFSTSPDASQVAVFDVREPEKPARVALLETGERGELGDLNVAGSHLYVAGSRGRDERGATYVFDLEDLSAPPRVLATGPLTTSAGATPDERFLVVSHGQRGGRVTIHDLHARDPATPLESIGAADYEINSFGPSRVRVKDQVAYVAWHQGGVQVIDLDTLDIDGRSQRVGIFGTAPGINPLAGAAGNVGVYPDVSDERILLVDSRWGLYVVDARRVLPPKNGEDLP